MIRIDAMADHIFHPNRRTVLAGLGAVALGASVNPAKAEQPVSVAFRAKPDLLTLREGEPSATIWSLTAFPRRLTRGDRLDIAFANDLPVPAVLNWHGIDGVAASEPWLSRAPLAPGTTDTFQLPLRHAGTYLCDMALIGDGTMQPARSTALIVAESEPVQVDRDEVFLIEGWRLKPDGTAIAPGVDPAGSTPVYTVNGAVMPDISVRGRERIRLRVINGLQRPMMALKIERWDVRIMALDGQPAEPFLARGGAFALPPGGRADVLIDVTPDAGPSSILLHDGEAARAIARLVTSSEPPIRAERLSPAPALPSNGLPLRLELKTALRVDLAIGDDHGPWPASATFAASMPPAFRVKAGRAVVVSLINRAPTTSVFHLHGHHFRLLDRLDDGWKPFWLDTIAIDAGQTQRIAFAADYAGRWLMETVETRWEAPRRVRWYSVA